jgi:ATP-dependent Clp protease ATP-binding subunit ClpB
MTSNVGSVMILERAGTSPWEEIEARVSAELRRTFRPEFLNRVDDIIVFRPLDEAQLERIVELQLERLRALLAERDITLDVTPDAEHIIAQEGYDPAFGARPLKRAIQRLVQNPLALKLLDGEFADGDTIVVSTNGAGELAFGRKGENAAR